MENVIDGSMLMMAALTPSAAKAMGGEMIHCSTTVVAGVRSTEGDPSLRPTATLMVLLSILRPSEEIGRALSQAPDSLVEAGKRRAIEVALEALSNRESAVADTLWASHVFWQWETVPTGGGRVVKLFNLSKLICYHN